MPKPYSLFNYRRNLVVMLILLQLLTVASILFLFRINTDRILIDNAYDSMAKTITQSVDHTRLFLKPAYKTIETLQLLANNNIINFNDIETIEKLFFTNLTDNENFAGIYIANDQSDFIYMSRKNTDEKSNLDLKEIFQTKIISNTSSQRNVIFRWRKANFIQTRLENIDNYAFDPKRRPWYRLASQTKNISWTEPYTFFTSKKRGITIATPFYNEANKQSGVIGIDIELDQLSNFLEKIQDNSYVRIIDINSNIIADSTNMNVLSDNKINNLIQSQKKSSKTLRGTFQENQNEYLFTQSLLMSNPSEPNWQVFSYTETSPFLAEVRFNEKRNILIALAILLLSILISALIAKKSSKPVESLMNQARTDNLTQLYNRHYFFNSGNTRYNEYIKTQNHNLSLIMIDLDFFKEVNDNYGHNIGDDVLKSISKQLKSLVKSEDLLARFGGEEFIVLSEVDSHHQAMRIAERIRSNIQNFHTSTAAGDINVTVSIGVYVTERDNKMSFLKFIDNADKALYHSKNNGRNKASLSRGGKIINNQYSNVSLSE